MHVCIYIYIMYIGTCICIDIIIYLYIILYDIPRSPLPEDGTNWSFLGAGTQLYLYDLSHIITCSE